MSTDEAVLEAPVIPTEQGLALVTKKVFAMPSYTTLGGKTILNLRIGYETYGRLNAAGDNAILITHYFSGTSHAAGRYAAEDKEAGYWDAIIGPGKAIDTDRYFVISSDTIANLNANDPNVVTTGPASIDPDTGKPYGMSFPIVTIRDFVHVQKALLDELGVTRLHAVAGPSMGAMQALEWGAAFPDMVERVAAVIPAGIEADPYLVAMLNLWSGPIRLDPAWNGGNYYGRPGPQEGLALALRLIMLNGRHYGWANAVCGRKAHVLEHELLQDFGQGFAIEGLLEHGSRGRARFIDPNSLLYTAKACQLYSLGHLGNPLLGVQKIKAKIMLMPARSDVLMFPDYAAKAAAALRAHDKQVDYFELEGEGGHFDGLLAIGQAASALRNFLNH